MSDFKYFHDFSKVAKNILKAKSLTWRKRFLITSYVFKILNRNTVFDSFVRYRMYSIDKKEKRVDRSSILLAAEFVATVYCFYLTNVPKAVQKCQGFSVKNIYYTYELETCRHINTGCETILNNLPFFFVVQEKHLEGHSCSSLYISQISVNICLQFRYILHRAAKQ